MKNADIIRMTERGVLEISTHCLSTEEAYKVYRFRKSLKEARAKISSAEMEMLKEVGIEDAGIFNNRFATLSSNQFTDKGLTDKEAEELNKLREMSEAYQKMRLSLLNDESNIYAPLLSYESWRRLQDENKAISVKDKVYDALSGETEDLLEGVLWEAPAD